MKTKNLVTLAVAALVVVLLAVLCLTGIQVGKYILIPAADGIARGNEFAKSTYVVLNVNEPAEVSAETEASEETAAEPVPASDELYDETIAIMRRRAESLTLVNIAVMEQGENRIRIEIPTENLTDASNILYTLTQPCHIYFTDANGEVVLEGEDIATSEMGVDSTGSYYYISFKVEEEALSAWADVTEDVNANATVWLDGVEMHTAPISQLLSYGMVFSDYGTAVTMGMAMETGRITANLTTEDSGYIPAELTEANFDGAMIAIAVAVLVAAIAMIVVFKGLGVVSALSIVLGAVVVTYFFGCVPYITIGAAGFFALAAALGVKVLCDIDLMVNVNKALASDDIVGKEAASAAWRISGLKALEICGVSIFVALVMQYFGGSAVSAFTSVFAIGSLVALLVTVIFTRPLVNCIVDKPAKESK